MTDIQHREILLELREIKLALQARQTPQASAPASTTSTRTPDSLPLPATVIERAGEVAVHFGKNAGVPIGKLNDKQLLWYGADREPQLKKDGTPFAPRDADVLLQNACRTLWHERRAGTTSSSPRTALDPATAPIGDEEVPF